MVFFDFRLFCFFLHWNQIQHSPRKNIREGWKDTSEIYCSQDPHGIQIPIFPINLHQSPDIAHFKLWLFNFLLLPFHDLIVKRLLLESICLIRFFYNILLHLLLFYFLALLRVADIFILSVRTLIDYFSWLDFYDVLGFLYCFRSMCDHYYESNP